MPKALARFLKLLLALASAVVALLGLLLGHEGKQLGEACAGLGECKAQLTCGAPMGTPYCTRTCDLVGPDDCPQGFACARWTPALPRDGVCRKQ